MADIKNERIEFCKQIYEKYNKTIGDIDDMFDRYDIINDTPDLWINGMYQHMNESERKGFYNLVDKDTSINPLSRNAILSRRELFFNNLTEQQPVLNYLTDEQWKVMSEIGNPYAPGNPKEHEVAPIPEMIYWRLAAGFITHEDAIRAFSTTGYTVGEDPQRTHEILSSINSRYGKIDGNLKEVLNKIKTSMQRKLIQERFDAFKVKYGEEPLYAEVTIRFKDDGTSHEDIIKLSDDIDERDDNKVFFNVTGLNDLKGLINPDNGEDFYIVDVQNITFQPKSLFLNDEKAMTVEKVQEKAVKLFGNNFEFDYWNETEAGTKIDRIDLGEMPDTISIDKLEIKAGQLSLYSNDIAGDVDLQALDDVELSKVDVSLNEIKSFLDAQKLRSGIDDDNKEKKPQIPNTKEELIALVGNDYKRETNFGALFFTETEDYGRKEPRKVSGISIKDNNIQFMGIHAPKSWEALTSDGQKKVCQWVHDNLELTRQLPDMFYQALDVLKDAETATGKQKEGYDMFQRVRDRLYFGDPTYVPDYRSWAGKVSNDFRYFIQPTELEKSTHYKELANALAIMPLIDIEKFAKEIENHPQRKVMCMEIDNQNSLREAKAKLFATILEAQKDLGKELSINPTTVVYNKQKDVVCKINVEVDYENDELLIGGVNEAGNDISAYNMGEILDNTDNVNALKKAIHEAHINHLEQEAKLAIHDRIVTPSARRFTSDQVEVLNRYHQVAAQDKPAGEVFKELLQEVFQEPDVARKPEKWVTDTAKELDDLAKGITREESRGLHK